MDSSYSREGYLTENYHVFHLRDTAGQERDFHFHDFDKIVILLSGKVDYLVERRSFSLQPWDILLVGHHVIHKALIDKSKPYERVIIYLDRQFIERATPEAGLMECFERADKQGRYLLSPDEAEKRTIAHLLSSMDGETDSSRFGAQAFRDTLLVQLLITIDRVSLRSAAAAEVPAPQYDPKIASTLSYINEHLTASLTVEELAERVYLSKYHFMRLFKAQTGSSVHAYVRQRRLLYAAQLIRTGVSAGKAAADSGFEEYSTFFRAFRECFGVSPGQLK